jgi:tetratricopeptide (TPR) repeat protein
MLNEKLEQASKDANKAQLRLAITGGIVTMFAGLVVLSYVLYQELSNRELQRANVATVETESGSPATQAMPAPVLPTFELPATTPPPAETTPGVGREEFKAAFKIFERDLVPQIANKNFEAWNSDAQRKILAMKDEASASFAIGQYKQALDLLAQATEQANAETSARDHAYERAMHDAATAKNADDYDAAKIQIAEALRLQPARPDALSQKREIDDLPAALDLLEAARVAGVENDAESELAHLSQLLILDPSRKGIRGRVETLARAIKEQSFAQYIANGVADVDRRDLDSARKNLSAAEKLYPNRQELGILAEKVTVLGRDLETERMLSEAQKAGRADNWQDALSFFGKARSIQPENKSAIDGYLLAQAITSSHEALSGYLQAPDRLSSSNVAVLAKKAVTMARSVSHLSPSITSMVENLEASLALYLTKVAVRVISDGQTVIAVRGIGRIGKVMGATIKLKPGNYSFEGKRAGYKSVLIEVKVPPGTDEVEVSVICNEQV